MTTSHTPGRLQLRAKYPQDIVTMDGLHTVARTLPQPTHAIADINARRMVACWNMLVNESTEDIEGTDLHAVLAMAASKIDDLNGRNQEALAQRDAANQAVQKLLTQRDELARALRMLDRWVSAEVIHFDANSPDDHILGAVNKALECVT